jgi:hypothetical protein
MTNIIRNLEAEHKRKEEQVKNNQRQLKQSNEDYYTINGTAIQCFKSLIKKSEDFKDIHSEIIEAISHRQTNFEKVEESISIYKDMKILTDHIEQFRKLVLRPGGLDDFAFYNHRDICLLKIYGSRLSSHGAEMAIAETAKFLIRATPDFYELNMVSRKLKHSVKVESFSGNYNNTQFIRDVFSRVNK